MPLTNLNHRACDRRLGRHSIQYPIIGHVAIPADFALFSSKSLPGKGRRQVGQWLLLSAFSGSLMGRPVNAHIDSLTPDMRLAIEIIDIRKQDAYPETLLDKAHGPLNFPFR